MVKKINTHKTLGGVSNIPSSQEGADGASPSQRMNIESFNSESGQERYNVDYITPAEEYLLDKYIPKGSKVLVLGCGTGRLPKYLKEKGCYVVGVDLAPNLIKIARKKYPSIKFYVDDMSTLKKVTKDYRREYFDIIYIPFGALDFCHPDTNRMQCLKLCEQFLRHNGILIYSTHDTSRLFLRFRPKFWFRNIMKGTLFSQYKYEVEEYGPIWEYYSTMGKQIRWLKQNSDFKCIELKRNSFNNIVPHLVFQLK